MTTINIIIKLQTSAWVSISIRSTPLICLVLSCLSLGGVVGLITHLKTHPNSTLLELRGDLFNWVNLCHLSCITDLKRNVESQTIPRILAKSLSSQTVRVLGLPPPFAPLSVCIARTL